MAASAIGLPPDIIKKFTTSCENIYILSRQTKGKNTQTTAPKPKKTKVILTQVKIHKTQKKT
jgi:hypothetical protein